MNAHSLLKNLCMAMVRFSGLPFFIRNVYARKKVAILLYHDPAPQTLETHLSYLSKRYRFITLDLLVEAIHQQDWSKIPAKSAVLTLDDGHMGNYRLLPLFRKYGVVPTIYLCSRIIGTHRHFWWKHAGNKAPALKNATHVRRLRMLEDQCGFSVEQEYPNRHAMNMAELDEMRKVTDFGAHTLFHPVLTTCTDEECMTEISGSKEDIEKMFGASCRHFSYPNGDYTEREIGYARDAGYLSARTIDVGWNDNNSDPYRLRVLGIADDASLTVMIAQLTGLPLYLKYLFNGSRGGKYPVIKPRRDEES